MRLIGYCDGCRRVRYVTVTGQELALAAAGGRRGDFVVHGLCEECEAAERVRGARELPGADTRPRARRRCNGCEQVRLTTETTKGPLCNDCLVRASRG